MSRICVKNLPKYISEDSLRDHFSKKGEVTDAKLARTSDGKSRQFGFIGYRTEREAEEAIRYFNKSYLDTCRITCEIAYKVGDPNIPRPWSRHSLKEGSESVKNDKKVSETKGFTGSEKEKKKFGKDSDIKSPQLQEFLEVMQPRVKSKSWANDTVITPTADQNGKVKEKQTPRTKKTIEKSAAVHTQSDEDDETEETGSLDRQVADNSPSLARDEVSDMEYFKSRVKKNWSDSDNSDSDDDGNDGDSNDGSSSLDGSPKEQDVQGVSNRPNNIEIDVSGDLEGKRGSQEDCTPELLDQDEKGVLDTSRLFVRNLPYTATEEDLEELFGKCGTISQVHLVLDKDTKRSKGIAYVLYTLPEFAARALEELDNTVFQGRLLHVMPAKQKTSSEKLETDAVASQGPRTFKQKRVEERKETEASGDTRAWNALFMRPDTVAENVARKYGVSKTDFLNTEADDLAVRIALGETQVIAETKKAFKNAGVNVESLEDFAAGRTDGAKRSNHILLVKNLPYGSSDGELAKMFGKFGSLDKIILPPTKTLALVVFLEPGEARAAFKGLAYKRYKDAPLYLEWAPANILRQTSTTEGNEKSGVVVSEKDEKRVIIEQHLEETSDADADPDRVQSRSLFVKNLNFKTTSESLKKHFVEHVKKGTVSSVKVAMHKKHGKDVSRGYGFVDFDSMETATNVCKDLQGTILDGHALILQLCQTKSNDQVLKKRESDKSSTKLLIRNIAFEAVKKDLRQLFSPFGQIKSLRLPVRQGHEGHRGFAFVEYVTKQEAKNALEALSSTHLYGRRLVLERAKEGETLEELRARTAAQFVDEDNGYQNLTKLSKKRKGMAVLDERKMKFERLAD